MMNKVDLCGMIGWDALRKRIDYSTRPGAIRCFPSEKLAAFFITLVRGLDAASFYLGNLTQQRQDPRTLSLALALSSVGGSWFSRPDDTNTGWRDVYRVVVSLRVKQSDVGFCSGFILPSPGTLAFSYVFDKKVFAYCFGERWVGSTNRVETKPGGNLKRQRTGDHIFRARRSQGVVQPTQGGPSMLPNTGESALVAGLSD
ncbi:hypothetical protein BCR43DRAFT_10467 [Syncephalastrum racemosum]|uniref:Uncharacterized protein n=1 Tax=Syncephalastrum racemosum TaxID=13706 RepID=A0A1X2HSA9_SYNRA|nr:hypothetical protein BCR43DRAFT_10467 [Syncephalastrum racemosum]